MAVSNPRFPHTCRIYRLDNATPWSDGEEVTLYEGECRKYTGYRPTDPDGVTKEIFALSIPLIMTRNGQMRAGDLVDITDRVGDWHGVVKSVMAGNLGTTLHWEDVKR